MFASREQAQRESAHVNAVLAEVVLTRVKLWEYGLQDEVLEELRPEIEDEVTDRVRDELAKECREQAEGDVKEELTQLLDKVAKLTKDNRHLRAHFRLLKAKGLLSVPVSLVSKLTASQKRSEVWKLREELRRCIELIEELREEHGHDQACQSLP